MLIESDFEVAAPVETVWTYLLDVPTLAPCLPGAELVGDDGNGTYEGLVTTRLGPVKLQFKGTATIREADEAARRIVMDAKGSETRGKGTARMTVTSTLVRSGGGTKVNVAQDLALTGAAAQFGRGLVADVTKVLLTQFAECVQAGIDAKGRGEQAAAGRTTPASGFGIGFKAALLALKRVFGRLFGSASRR